MAGPRIQKDDNGGTQVLDYQELLKRYLNLLSDQGYYGDALWNEAWKKADKAFQEQYEGKKINEHR